MEKTFDTIEELFVTMKDYADIRIESLKINAAEKISLVLANVLAGIIVAGVFLFFIIFCSTALALGLGVWFSNIWLGFLVVAILYLLIGFIVWKARIKLIQLPIMNSFISQLFGHDDKEEN
jgi:ABC-type antimicrobial peptide transport system permease subunit